MFNPTAGPTRSTASPARIQANRANSSRSTGPTSPGGKQTSALNGFKHGLTGQRMILQAHEIEPYRRLTEALTAQYQPATETESQFVQRIIDCHMRLNRIAAIDCNLLNVTQAENTRAHTPHNEITESVVAQTRAWVQHADSFEKLGRYEARISRQLLQVMHELDRLQDLRKKLAQPAATKPDTAKLASSCALPPASPVATPETRVMTAVSASPAPQTEPARPANAVNHLPEAA